MLWFNVADGIRLRALDWGGDGAPVLLLHGGALTAQTWDYVCVGLRSEFRLIALDMRGHGESSWSDDYSIGRLAADAAQTAAALGLPRLHVAGMSLGGVVAAELALTTTDLVRSLAMVDVAPGVEFDGTARMRGFLNGMTGAPSVSAVTDAAMRTSPGSDRERVSYRMNALLRQRADGVWQWRRDSRRIVDYPHILSHIQGLEGRVGSFCRAVPDGARWPQQIHAGAGGHGIRQPVSGWTFRRDFRRRPQRAGRQPRRPDRGIARLLEHRR